MCKQANYMLEVKDLLKMGRSIWYDQFIRFSYCLKMISSIPRRRDRQLNQDDESP